MRKHFLLFWALLATTCLWAHDFVVDGIYYNFLDGNNVAVTYKGSSYDAYNNEYSGEVTIPETVTYNGTTYSVTSIGNYAFELCTSLTSITIPNSVTSIGKYAFDDCTSLTSITIPNSVTSIGDFAFASCDNLASVTIGNSVTSIGDFAFPYCRSLTSITIPNSVTSIGYFAFYWCTSLTSITIPKSVTSIGDGAFRYCSSLTSMVVEEGNITYDSRDNCNAIIETATNTLIAGCQNTIIPNSVTSIGGEVFSGCSSLTSIVIPNSVKGIGWYAFSDCSSLTSIVIPNSVTSIGDYAFIGCTSLTSMVVETGNTIYDSRDNCNAIIETATNTLIAGCQNTIIPNSVTSIGDEAFYRCSSLTSITIPNSVTSIGGGVFSGCSSLTSIVISNSVTSIGGGVFYGCSSLTSITIPNSVTSIGESAFDGCSSLTSITIPNSVMSIGDRAFAGCSSLTTVICEAVEVPELEKNVFLSMPLSDATLFVPAQSLDDYKAADQWKEFGTILPSEDTPSSVENIPSTTTNFQKIIRDGNLVIIRDGVEYNVMGQQL